MKKQTDDFMAMKGAGYYSRATLGAKHVMDNAAGLILDALDRKPPENNAEPFTMTDMGAADGGTSLDMVGRVLHHVRELAPGRPLRMIYTDLPRTDFSALFRNVHGLEGRETYAAELDNLFIHASATSFHQQIVPEGSLDLGHSATASHYITEVPEEIPDHLHMVRAEGAVRRAFQEKGAKDWKNFLELRAKELRTGGLLALFNFGIDEEGRWLGHTGGVSMFDTFNALWSEMTEEGVLSQSEYRATNFPQVYRTVEEFRAPFDASEVEGLELERIETRVVPCPFAEDFRGHGDGKAFAKAYIPTLRSWSEPVFLAGLKEERSPEEKAEIVDAFYRRYEDLVAKSPEGHGMDYVHCYMICRRV